MSRRAQNQSISGQPDPEDQPEENLLEDEELPANRRIGSLSSNEKVSMLEGWGIDIPPPSYIDRIFRAACISQLKLKGLDARDAEVNKLLLDDVATIITPDWVRKLRSMEVTESEVQAVIDNLGTHPAVLCSAEAEEIDNLKIKPAARRRIKMFIANLRREVNSPSESSVTQLDEPIDPEFEHCPVPQVRVEAQPVTSIVQPTPNEQVSNSTNQNLSIQPIDKPERFNVMPRFYPKEPKLPQFNLGDDAYRWLRRVKRQLSLEDVDDTVRLRCLKKALDGELLDAAAVLDKRHSDYESYINGLFAWVTGPAAQAVAQGELSTLRYRFEEKPTTFITKLRELVRKVKGEMSDQAFLMEVMEHLPVYVQDQIYSVRANKSLDDVLDSLIHMYNRQQRDKDQKNRAMSKSAPRPNEIKKAQPNQTQVTNPVLPPNQVYRPPGQYATNQPRVQITCHNCGLKGHLSRDCRSPRRTLPERANPVVESTKPKTVADNLEGPNPSSIKVCFPAIAANPLPKRKENVVTALGEAVPLNVPTVELNFCQPDKQPIFKGEVLLDSGANASCMDFKLANSMNAYIVPSSMVICGIVPDVGLNVYGSAYAVLQHSDMKECRILRFQVIKNFPPVMLLGNRFSDLFYTITTNHGGLTDVLLREFDGGKTFNAKIKFRFCTPEETIKILDHGVETERKVADNNSNPLKTQESSSSIDDSTHHQHYNESESSQTVLLVKDEFNVTEVSDTNKLKTPCETFVNRLNVTLSGKDEIKAKASDYPTNTHLTEFQQKLLRQISKDLTEEQRDAILNVLVAFKDVFAQNSRDLGMVPSSICPVTIDIGNEKVPCQKAYPCSVEKRKAFQTIISDLLNADIIEASHSDAGSPSILVPKTDGTYRLVVDYRALNRLTKLTSYPMPRIDDILEAVRGTKYFNMLDLFQGYFQIELSPMERLKTAFITPDGKYQFKRLPMGLACAPFVFQKLVYLVLDGLAYTKCLGYFDDIPVLGSNFEELLTNTVQVLGRLRTFNLKCKTEKCTFGASEILLLGHIVNGQGIKPDPDKVAALKALPYPRNVRELQSQLGCYNYFSRYIPNYSRLAAPLYRLVSRERKFCLLKEDKQALDKLRSTLIETTLLVHFDPNLRRKLTADASDIAVGGILLQEDPNQPVPEPYKTLKEVPIDQVAHWLPISFYSQRLKPHQRSYSVSEKELLGIFVGVVKFQHYLEGDSFLIETDHHALCQLPRVNFKNSRLQRWSIMMSSFKYQIVYREGKTHPPDCFSRYQSEWDHRKAIDPEQDYIEHLLSVNCEPNWIAGEIYDPDEFLYEIGLNYLLYGLEAPIEPNHNHLNVFYVQKKMPWKWDLQWSQLKDPECVNIIQSLRKDERSPYSKKYLIRDELLYRRNDHGHNVPRVVITKDFLEKLFKEEHSSRQGGHFGVEKTYLQISRRFWMRHLFDEIDKLCKNCLPCQMAKPANSIYSEAYSKPIPKEIFERYELDALGPVQFSGSRKKVILVIIDTLSRFVYAKAYNNQTAPVVIKFLSEVFSTLGYPKVIQTDRGTNFLSEEVESFLRENGVQHDVSNPYHPQSQGIVERTNRTIGERLRTCILQEEFDNLEGSLQASIFAINSSVHKITRFSPYFLVYGKLPRKVLDNELNLPSCELSVVEARRLARARLIAQQSYYLNRARAIEKGNPFEIGDAVLVKQETSQAGTSKKLTQKYHGPYVVCDYRKGSLKLLNVDNFELFTSNLNRVKPYKGDLPEKFKIIMNSYFNPNSSDWLASPDSLVSSNSSVDDSTVIDNSNDLAIETSSETVETNENQECFQGEIALDSQELIDSVSENVSESKRKSKIHADKQIASEFQTNVIPIETENRPLTRLQARKANNDRISSVYFISLRNKLISSEIKAQSQEITEIDNESNSTSPELEILILNQKIFIEGRIFPIKINLIDEFSIFVRKLCQEKLAKSTLCIFLEKSYLVGSLKTNQIRAKVKSLSLTRCGQIRPNEKSYLLTSKVNANQEERLRLLKILISQGKYNLLTLCKILPDFVVRLKPFLLIQTRISHPRSVCEPFLSFINCTISLTLFRVSNFPLLFDSVDQSELPFSFSFPSYIHVILFRVIFKIVINLISIVSKVDCFFSITIYFLNFNFNSITILNLIISFIYSHFHKFILHKSKDFRISFICAYSLNNLRADSCVCSDHFNICYKHFSSFLQINRIAIQSYLNLSAMDPTVNTDCVNKPQVIVTKNDLPSTVPRDGALHPTKSSSTKLLTTIIEEVCESDEQELISSTTIDKQNNINPSNSSIDIGQQSQEVIMENNDFTVQDLWTLYRDNPSIDTHSTGQSDNKSTDQLTEISWEVQSNLGDNDPLPPETADAVKPKPPTEDNSDYPNPKLFKAGHFPVPKPGPLPDYLSEEAFKHAQQKASERYSQLEQVKEIYFRFLKEKIKLNLLKHFDVDSLDLSRFPKGLNVANVVHPELPTFFKQIVCQFCEHILVDPRMCSMCKLYYCTPCAAALHSLITLANLKPAESLSYFLCIHPICVAKMAYQGNYAKLIPIISDGSEKMNVIDKYWECQFICPRPYCSIKVPARNYEFHSRHCRKGLLDYTMDPELQLSFVHQSDSVRNSELPKHRTLASVIPHHLRDPRAGLSHERRWNQTFELWAYLLRARESNPDDPWLQPTTIRSQANLRQAHFENREVLRDPSAPISEAEDFLQRIGFAPTIGTRPGPEVVRQPASLKWNRVPSYLLESPLWIFASRYPDIMNDSDSTTSETPSLILYNHEIEDSDSPFIKIDPFMRLSPSRRELALNFIRCYFPNCSNPMNEYLRPRQPGSERTRATQEQRRRKLTEAFNSRPPANIPPMYEGHLRAIEASASENTFRDTIFCLKMFTCLVWEGERKVPRPIWVVIIDGNYQVVYETFVSYGSIENLQGDTHGLDRSAFRYAKTLRSVRDQVIRYLASADVIVGSGLISHFQSLGLTKQEIDILGPRLREITQFYSPYYNNPMSLHVIAYLWFTGYILPAEPHSPLVEAITAMRLYLLQWQAIERRANLVGGMYHRTTQSTSGNSITSSLLYLFDREVCRKRAKWPDEWRTNRKMVRSIPYYEDEFCVPIDQHFVKTLETAIKRWAQNLSTREKERNSDLEFSNAVMLAIGAPQKRTQLCLQSNDASQPKVQRLESNSEPQPSTSRQVHFTDEPGPSSGIPNNKPNESVAKTAKIPNIVLRRILSQARGQCEGKN